MQNGVGGPFSQGLVSFEFAVVVPRAKATTAFAAGSLWMLQLSLSSCLGCADDPPLSAVHNPAAIHADVERPVPPKPQTPQFPPPGLPPPPGVLTRNMEQPKAMASPMEALIHQDLPMLSDVPTAQKLALADILDSDPEAAAMVTGAYTSSCPTPKSPWLPMPPTYDMETFQYLGNPVVPFSLFLVQGSLILKR